MQARMTIHELLEDARRGLRRVDAFEMQQALREGAIVIDTRSHEQRRAHGVIPGARHHALSVLEWRLDPDSDHRDPGIELDDWIILVCAEGYSSSLAAARLQMLGFHRATDLIDGVAGWRQAGLPLLPADEPMRMTRCS
jgi:rhodanese-related sulfurtransferase